MAEGILRSFNDPELEVYSAGIFPASKVHPLAIKVMQEIGIDISKNEPKPVSIFSMQEFDYVITVCDSAKELCPAFTGKVKNRLHFSFQDPAVAIGNDEEIITIFRKVRDEIKITFTELYQNELKSSAKN